MRILLRSLCALILLLALISVAGYGYLQYSLKQLPLQHLDYRIHSIGLHHLTLEQLQFRMETNSGAIDTALHQLEIQWQWHFLSPQLVSVILQEAHIELTPASITVEQPDSNAVLTTIPLPSDWQLPAFLPQQIILQQLYLSIPCQQQQCRYLATAELIHQDELWQLMLNASPENQQQETDPQQNNHPLQLKARYQLQNALPRLEINLELQQSLHFTLHAMLEADNGHWLTGDTQFTLAPPPQWLQQQAAEWGYPLPPQWLEQFRQPVELVADWHWRLTTSEQLSQLTPSEITQQLTGNMKLDATMPSALAIPGIGWIKGQLKLELQASDGEITAYDMNGQAQLTELVIPSDLRQAGIAADSLTVAVQSSEQKQPQPDALPLALQLKTTGTSEASARANIILNTIPPYSVLVERAELAIPNLSFSPASGLTLKKLQAQAVLSGYWKDGSWRLDIAPESLLSSQLHYQQLLTEKLQLQFSRLILQGNSHSALLNIDSQLHLSAEQLAYPALHRQNWQWQATVNGDLQNANVSGTVSNSAGLTIEHQLQWQENQGTLNWQLADIFMLAGNPLATTLNDWPPLLEFNRGRLAASGDVSFNQNGLLNSQSQLRPDGLAGIYDRSLFKGLSGQLNVNYRPGSLKLHTAPLQLDEINYGFVAGPLQLKASYQATPETPLNGTLELESLLLAIMGGTVNAGPQLLDLSKENQLLNIRVNQLELAQLLQQHPSSELNGTGRISGVIPLGISPKGFSVEKGQLAAETPGGQLQYRSDSASGMAASNQGMKIILDALNDFHYSVLSSNVSYDTSGILLLALRLEGLNPAMENGRAVNFNITLEEDIPALITSLQLSSQISDKIKQRVQQRLQNRGKPRSSGETP